jgi:hypothetical protein
MNFLRQLLNIKRDTVASNNAKKIASWLFNDAVSIDIT